MEIIKYNKKSEINNGDDGILNNCAKTKINYGKIANMLSECNDYYEIMKNTNINLEKFIYKMFFGGYSNNNLFKKILLDNSLNWRFNIILIIEINNLCIDDKTLELLIDNGITNYYHGRFIIKNFKENMIPLCIDDIYENIDKNILDTNIKKININEDLYDYLSKENIIKYYRYFKHKIIENYYNYDIDIVIKCIYEIFNCNKQYLNSIKINFDILRKIILDNETNIYDKFYKDLILWECFYMETDEYHKLFNSEYLMTLKKYVAKFLKDNIFSIDDIKTLCKDEMLSMFNIYKMNYEVPREYMINLIKRNEFNSKYFVGWLKKNEKNKNYIYKLLENYNDKKYLEHELVKIKYIFDINEIELFNIKYFVLAESYPTYYLLDLINEGYLLSEIKNIKFAIEIQNIIFNKIFNSSNINLYKYLIEYNIYDVDLFMDIIEKKLKKEKFLENVPRIVSEFHEIKCLLNDENIIKLLSMYQNISIKFIKMNIKNINIEHIRKNERIFLDIEKAKLLHVSPRLNALIFNIKKYYDINIKFY